MVEVGILLVDFYKVVLYNDDSLVEELGYLTNNRVGGIMTLQEMIQKRQDITCDILKCLQKEVTEIKVSAEYMIECATNIKGQGYSTFISSRQDFLDRIDNLSSELLESSNSTCKHY